jgi:hypothetical protein
VRNCMLQASVSSVSNVSGLCCKYFIRMLQKYIGMLHMLQWYYTYVARFCSQSFICFFDVRCKCVYLNVAYVFIHRKCKCFYLNVVYVYNGFKCFSDVFGSGSDPCFKCFICFQTYVAIVASSCFKTRLSVACSSSPFSRLARYQVRESGDGLHWRRRAPRACGRAQ